MLRVALWLVPVEFAHHQHYAQDVAIIRAGGNLYVEQFFYNYTPLWGWLLTIMPTPAPLSARLLVTAADLVVGAVLLRLGGQKAAAGYLLCPLTILNGGMIAQFEPIPLAFLVVAVYLSRAGTARQAQLPVHCVGAAGLAVPAASRGIVDAGDLGTVCTLVRALSARWAARHD